MTRQQDRDPPRALLVTRNLPPLLGGMERLNLHIATEVAKTYRLAVIGPAGCKAFLPAGVDVVELPARPLRGFLWKSLVAAWSAARDKPSLVIAGSGLTVPMAKVAAMRCGGKAIAYVHGLDLVTRHPAYRLLWMPFLRKLDHAWANSASTADIAARIGVARRRISLLPPGVSLPGDGDGETASQARERFGLADAKVLLAVGRLTARKGLAQFIAKALPEIERRHPGIVFLVVGEEASDAIDASGAGVRESILRAADEAGMREVVRLVPHCSDEVLAGIYRAADVHVFPGIAVAGDIEGFGMVAVEAAAHGTPTVAFALGGIPDAVAHGTSGRLVAPGDYSAFADEVCRSLEAPDGAFSAGARRFAAGFEWSCFGDRLREGMAALRTGNAHAGGPEGHAVLDLQSRAFKARKIEAVLGLNPGQGPLRILEIGTGSGGIAHYFGTHRSLRCEVHAVDVRDARQVFAGYRFSKVDGVALPFEDASFDVVISNHVIEHVGGARAQEQHLAEMRRVLSPTGQGYLAVPNRWMLTEPHYRLAFLSWLPTSLRSRYLKWRRGVEVYDCEPLEAGDAERMFRRAGLRFERATGRALKATIALERAHQPLLQWLVERIPEPAIDRVTAVVPTLVYRFASSEVQSGSSAQ